MVRGNVSNVKVHYKGANDDFVIYVESAEAVENWKKDKSVPLAQVVDSFDVFVTHKQGAQGILDKASNSQLDGEFGSHKDEDVVEQIINKGEVQESKPGSKYTDKNLSNGPGNNAQAHG